MALLMFGTTTSSLPSLFTSPTATVRGPLPPVAKTVTLPNVPLPLPRRTATLLAFWLPVMASSRPSPLKSARATSQAPAPMGRTVGVPKRAVAVAQQHRHGAAGEVGGDDVEACRRRSGRRRRCRTARPRPLENGRGRRRFRSAGRAGR